MLTRTAIKNTAKGSNEENQREGVVQSVEKLAEYSERLSGKG